MSVFGDLLADVAPGGVLDHMRKVSEVTVSEAKRELPMVPADYLAFLLDIGSGTIGDGSFSVSEGLIRIDDIFDFLNRRDVFLIGDDFSGVSYGFMIPDGAFVEIDSATWETRPVETSFAAFIREVIAMAKDNRRNYVAEGPHRSA